VPRLPSRPEAVSSTAVVNFAQTAAAAARGTSDACPWSTARDVGAGTSPSRLLAEEHADVIASRSPKFHARSSNPRRCTFADRTIESAPHLWN
jgi:hypothetical protein